MSNSPSGAPIVLVHGLFGFGRAKVANFSIVDYFRLIPGALRQAGNIVAYCTPSRTGILIHVGHLF
jgi:hypothetical protein